MASERAAIDLSQRQLHRLAETLRLQEVEKLYEIDFNDYGEQQKYLESCRDAFERTRDLLNDIQTMKDKVEAEKNAAKISIANDIFEYSQRFVNTTLQLIRSYDTRLTLMTKVSAHTTDLIQRLNTIDPATQIEEASRLANEAAMYKAYIIDYERKVKSLVSNDYTRWIKESGTTVEDLVIRYMAELGFVGPFENLTDIQKLQVYERIIEAAGQGKSVVTYSTEALGRIGVISLVFTAASFVWDIGTKENKLEAVENGAINLLKGVTDVSTIAKVAIQAGFQALNIKVATLAVTVMGSIVGFGVGALVGIAAGALLDLIFRSGSTVQPSDNLTVCLVAPMPSGLELARLIQWNFPDE